MPWHVNRYGERRWVEPKCGTPHPDFPRKFCKLDAGHVGVHEVAGMRWWGSVRFPRLGETRLRDGA
jgi:hypothetical protein